MTKTKAIVCAVLIIIVTCFYSFILVELGAHLGLVLILWLALELMKEEEKNEKRTTNQ